MATPMVNPKAASDPIHPSRRPTDWLPSAGWGQTEESEMASASESTTRLIAGPAESPGIGTKAMTPDTRASTSRKPNSVDKLSARLAYIAAEVAEQGRCIGNEPGRHPGQKQQQSQ